MPWVYHETNKYGSMSQADMENNATLIYNQLSNKGWSINAISGLLGNMQRESSINPAQWQGGFDIGSSKGGYGLVQFTPSTKYTNWCTSQGYDIHDGYTQVKAVDEQPWGTEYIKTSAYPMTYAQFKVSTATPEILADVFCANYERAGVTALSERETYARNWYNYLTGKPTPPEPPPPPPTPASKRKKMPLYMMCRKF